MKKKKKEEVHNRLTEHHPSPSSDFATEVIFRKRVLWLRYQPSIQLEKTGTRWLFSLPVARDREQGGMMTRGHIKQVQLVFSKSTASFRDIFLITQLEEINAKTGWNVHAFYYCSIERPLSIFFSSFIILLFKRPKRKDAVYYDTLNPNFHGTWHKRTHRVCNCVVIISSICEKTGKKERTIL